MAATTADIAEHPIGLPRRISFRIVVGFIALVMIGTGGKGIVIGWFSPMDGGIHRWHELAWGVIEGVILFGGLAAVLRRSHERVAAMQQVLAGSLALIATMILGRVLDPFTGVFVLLVLAASLLHPARGQLLRAGRVDPALLAVAVVAAVPLVLYALGQIGIHHAAPANDPHAPIAHYAGTTAAALGIPLVAAVAALRSRGNAMPLWSAAVGAGVLGLASVIYPTQDSSFGLAGGAVAIAWAVTFLVVGRRRS